MKTALISSILASALAAVPYVPSDAERARWTMSDLRSLATAVEAYAVDHKSYPAAKTLAELLPLIQPTYVRKAPAVDAWGHAYVYVPSPDGKSYRFASAGSDGTTDPSSWGSPGPLDSFDQDAVVDTGSLTRPWPYR